MYTNGFACAWSGIVTVGTDFAFPNATFTGSTYLIVDTTGGDIVFINPQGTTCVWKSAGVGLNPIAAKRVVASAVINSVTYTTAANVVGWAGDPKY